MALLWDGFLVLVAVALVFFLLVSIYSGEWDTAITDAGWLIGVAVVWHLTHKPAVRSSR